MAVVFGYSISDPLLDSSYPLYAMDGIAAYASYREDGSTCLNHAVSPYYSHPVQNALESSTEYNSNFMLCFTSDRQLNTAYQHVCSFQYLLSTDYLVENLITPRITSNNFTLKSHNEQFSGLVSFFGFNKTEWADIFSVSRPTIYGWLKNEIKPSGENASKISRLYSLFNAIPDRQERDRLYARYLHHHISACNCSLYEIFKSGVSAEYEISDLLEILSSLLKRSRQKAKELDELEDNCNPSETTFEHNMSSLFS